MNILLISQCQKRALKETRRILDQFAQRHGSRTWQTPMTKAGLDTLHRLLRQSARKNTAVACYWTHGKNLTELLWIVGDRSQFNDDGCVPTNQTKRNILRTADENSWLYASSIQTLATIAALLHDLGKATIGFQKKLTDTVFQADPYRHEWISLQLFHLMLKDCQSNEDCLERLANFAQYRINNPNWYLSLKQTDKGSMDKLPPIAQFIGWLIVTHHRMPFYHYFQSSQFKAARADSWKTTDFSLKDFYRGLKVHDNWLKRAGDQPSILEPTEFWIAKEDITASQSWQKQLSRWANKALNNPALMLLSKNTIENPFIFYSSRLCLMLGDHNYSSLKKSSTDRIKGDKNINLIANTDSNREANQSLDEHLMGVAKLTARFGRLLPKLKDELPAIKKHKPFTQRTRIKQFTWQNKAYDLAKAQQANAQEQGFFGVNMASTGCGKTLGNARIMYALANPKIGARFTIALGLRILTLQTGLALQDKLQLNDDHLAILVGNQANTKLFNLSQANTSTGYGSESDEDMIDGWVYATESGIDQEELGTVIANPKAKQLLYQPLVSCTIDHLMSASESQRGGKQIVPLLRLLTADLILDEPDDFGQEDLPALTRLVHLAGMFGSKVLLSSATLTPDLITGLFDAYQAGRIIWQQQNQLAQQGVVCAWFDEYQQSHAACHNKQDFEQEHEKFVLQRSQKLQQQAPRRIAQILDVNLPAKPENQDIDYAAFSHQLLSQAHQLHEQHGESLPDSNIKISLGLIRFAHIKQLIPTLLSMYQQQDLPENTIFHLCCYHARQLLILRNGLENKLDRLLNRHQAENLFQQVEIINAIKDTDASNHIFIVLATPVAEVGRDHSYSWAIVEPSSMRSIIQLAGRVWRHQPERIAKSANITLLNSNIKSLSYGNALGVGEATFVRPGFEEKPNFLLSSHNTHDLIPQWQLSDINAIARIQKPENLQPRQYLADLEHAVMADLLNSNKANFVNAYWQQGLAHHANVHLQKISPFRYQARKQSTYVCQPDTLDSLWGFSFRLAEKAWENPDFSHIDTENKCICYQAQINTDNPKVKPWLQQDLADELNKLAEQLDRENINRLALEFATIELEEQNMWKFHPWLGFW